MSIFCFGKLGGETLLNKYTTRWWSGDDDDADCCGCDCDDDDVVVVEATGIVVVVDIVDSVVRATVLSVVVVDVVVVDDAFAAASAVDDDDDDNGFDVEEVLLRAARPELLWTRCIFDVDDVGASNNVIDPFIGIRNCTTKQLYLQMKIKL